MKGDPDTPSAPAYPMPHDEETGSIASSIEGEHCDDPKEKPINLFTKNYVLQSSTTRHNRQECRLLEEARSWGKLCCRELAGFVVFVACQTSIHETFFPQTRIVYSEESFNLAAFRG